MDDVIPEVVLIFRSRNPNFWILRSFLRQNRSMLIFLKSVLSLSKTISSLRYPVIEIPDFQKGAPGDVTNQICLDEAFFWTLKNDQLWNSITSSKINIFWCVFFVWIAQLRTIKLTSKIGGLGEGGSAPFRIRCVPYKLIYSNIRSSNYTILAITSVRN